MEVHVFCTPSHRPLFERFLLPSATQAGFTVKVVDAQQSCLSGSYMAEGWTETMRQKITHILGISRAQRGDVFIYSDCDILFNAKNFNPDIAMKDFGPTAFAAFQDDVVQYCAGFMILRASQTLDELLLQVLEHIDHYKEDQTALNAVLKNFPVSAGRLPRKEYLCIRQLSGTLNDSQVWNSKPFTLSKRLKIFHANWTKDVEAKERLLEYAAAACEETL